MAPNRIGPEPTPGDLIEIFRDGYQHWAVSVGRGYVVHLVIVDNGPSAENLADSPFGWNPRAVVKKEQLSEVATGCKYRVNNKLDQELRPLPTAEIILNALALSGEGRCYSLTQKNCEQFAKELRYGELIYYQNRVGPDPKPGDLIEIFSDSYQHWTVSVGGGYVVHLITVENSASSPAGQCTGLVVKKELLSTVAAGCKYRVNNKLDRELFPLPAEDIVQKALALSNEGRSYSLTQKNCEQFVTELRYGEFICYQGGRKKQNYSEGFENIFPPKFWLIATLATVFATLFKP